MLVFFCTKLFLYESPLTMRSYKQHSNLYDSNKSKHKSKQHSLEKCDRTLLRTLKLPDEAGHEVITWTPSRILESSKIQISHFQQFFEQIVI